MQAPSQWLTPELTLPTSLSEQGAAEADLVSVAWAVRWERERTRRLVALAPDALRPDRAGLLTGRPGNVFLYGRGRAADELPDREMAVRLLRRMMILKAALRRSKCAWTSARGASRVGDPRLSDVPSG